MLKFEQLSIKNSSKSNRTFLDKKQKIFQKLTKVFFGGRARLGNVFRFSARPKISARTEKGFGSAEIPKQLRNKRDVTFARRHGEGKEMESGKIWRTDPGRRRRL